MRLHRDDMVAMGQGNERRLYRVQKLSGQSVVLVEHHQAGKGQEVPSTTKRATRVLQEGIRRVSVDVLGRVQDGGPFGLDGRGRSGRA